MSTFNTHTNKHTPLCGPQPVQLYLRLHRHTSRSLQHANLTLKESRSMGEHHHHLLLSFFFSSLPQQMPSSRTNWATLVLSFFASHWLKQQHDAWPQGKKQSKCNTSHRPRASPLSCLTSPPAPLIHISRCLSKAEYQCGRIHRSGNDSWEPL